MSSNIRLNKKCELCGKSFTAKTTVTKYCSDGCAKKAYKKKKRKEKIIESVMAESPAPSNTSNSSYLTVLDIMNMFNISKSSGHRFIKRNNLPKKKIGKWVYIKRADVEKIFQEQEREHLVGIEEAAMLFNVSTRTIERYVSENKILSEKVLSKRLIHKSSIFKALNNSPLPDKYYASVGEIQRLFNISERALFEIISRNNIMKFRRGKNVLILKCELQKIFK